MKPIVGHAKTYLLAGLIALTAVRITSGQPSRIVAEGEGLTRNAALQSALRNAIEQGVGVVIGSETLVHGGVLIRDQIIAKSSGYVRDFAVVHEQHVAGTWTVSVSASVDFLSKLEQDMLGMAMLLERTGWPRIMAIPDEIIDGKPASTWATTTALEEFFLAKGLSLVDATQVRENRRRDIERAAGDPALAAEIGRQYGAEVVLVGYARAAFAESTEPLPGVGLQHFFTANLNLKLVETAGASILASSSSPPTRGGSSTKEAGAQLALRRAAEQIAPKLFLQTICRWSQDADESKEYEIWVVGTDNPTLESIRNAIAGDDRVRGVTDATLANGIAKFRVRSAGSLSDLKGIVGRRVNEPHTLENPTLARLELRLLEPKTRPAAPSLAGETVSAQYPEEPPSSHGAGSPSGPSPDRSRPEGARADDPVRTIAAVILVVSLLGAFTVLVVIVRKRGSQ